MPIRGAPPVSRFIFLAARFSLMDIPGFLVIAFLGDLSAIAGLSAGSAGVEAEPGMTGALPRLWPSVQSVPWIAGE